MSRSGLEELREQMQGKYPMGCAKELEDTEAALVFSEFTSDTALSLGTVLVHTAEQYNEDIIALIVREKDQIPVFQYIGDESSQRNVDFAMKKRNTVLQTGHCSLWAMAQAQTKGGLDDVFGELSVCLPVGGAFPIYVSDELLATICVSGLHDGMDHELIVEALSSYLDVKVPVFHGTLI